MKPFFIAPQVALYDASEASPEIPKTAIALPQMKSDAFGDGSHPTTRLCAGAVDFLCRQNTALSFLDVGTGTGVLARIARARGVSFIAATDIDPQALASAQANAQLDSTMVKIDISNHAPDHWGPRFDLVAANILEGPLNQLAPALYGALKPQGVLVLSGFTPLQTPFLRVTFERTGLVLAQESHLEGWALLMFRYDAGLNQKVGTTF